MDEKIKVMGICVDNLNVRQTIQKVAVFLNSNSFHSISVITMQMLLLAAENDSVKESIESMDMTVVGDKELLPNMGIQDEERVEEVSDGLFIREFIRRLDKNRKSVYILAADEEVASYVGEYLKNDHKNIKVSGVRVLKEEAEEFETVNEINGTAPDVVLSFLPSPVQEEFYSRNKNMLMTKLWASLGENVYGSEEGDGIVDRTKKFFQTKLFNKAIKNFEEESEE